MNRYDAEQRLDLSDRIATSWKQMGGPQGKPEQIAKMIDTEIEILGEIAADRPATADRTDDLIARYRWLRETYCGRE